MRTYIMRFLRLCWTLLHQVSKRVSLLCWLLSITISYLHRAYGLIHSTNNAACAIEKPSTSMTPPMSKPYADLGGNICGPCHASGPGRHLCHTKDCKKTASTATYNFNTTTCYPQPSSPPVFTPEDRLYLRYRLPLQMPTIAQTARLHFAQLTLVYQGLAEQSLARAATMVPGPARERRLRMGILAARLAVRYCGYRVVLSDEFINSVMRRHANGARRPSRFWEAVLDEVKRANSSWSLARLWILIFTIQSSLVMLSSWLLPPEARTALMAASTLGHGWSITVIWELMNARYFAVKADEQELHDLMGGL